MEKKLKVWLVDDREENRERFRENHGKHFDLRVFEKPDEVLQAIQLEGQPDALLCDIYFYDDPRQREEIEAQVKKHEIELGRLATDFGADQAQLGIGLIANVRKHFGESPHFPIYAYTSKGPYLLQHEGFNRLEMLEALWLFKNKYSPQTEYKKIVRDVEQFRDRFNWPNLLRHYAWKVGLASALLSVLLDRLLQYFGW